MLSMKLLRRINPPITINPNPITVKLTLRYKGKKLNPKNKKERHVSSKTSIPDKRIMNAISPNSFLLFSFS